MSDKAVRNTYFEIRERSIETDTPIYESISAVYNPFLVQTTKSLDDSCRQFLRVEIRNLVRLKKRVDSGAYRIHCEGNARPVVATTKSMKLIGDTFLVAVQEEIRDILLTKDEDRLVFPVQHSLEELLATKIVTCLI